MTFWAHHVFILWIGKIVDVCYLKRKLVNQVIDVCMQCIKGSQASAFSLRAFIHISQYLDHSYHLNASKFIFFLLSKNYFKINSYFIVQEN